MTRDDILRMAHEANEYADRVLSPGEFHPDKHDVRDLHFATLVAAAEREACAVVCERLPETFKIAADEFGYKAEVPTAENYAAAIRARGEA